MLLFTIAFGGLLMMGHQARGESLFYYFRLEDQVPENHLLRLIDRHVNFEFIRAKLKDRYSDQEGHRSLHVPQLLLQHAAESAISTRVDELRRETGGRATHHLAWRWSSPDWASDQEIPHHSTFIQRTVHGRFQVNRNCAFQELFEEIVAVAWQRGW